MPSVLFTIAKRSQSQRSCAVQRWLGVALLVISVCSSAMAMAMAMAMVMATVATAGLPHEVAKVLEHYRLRQDGLSVYAKDVASQKVVLAHQAEALRNPASVMKLVTTLAALDTLGPGYQWHTEVWGDGAIRAKRLQGDLYFRGGGDPYLLLEDFWLLLRRLQQQWVSAIDGDIVIDRAYFDLPPVDASAFDGKPYRNYNTLPDALLLNFKSTRFSFYPQEIAATVSIASEPPASGLTFDNRLKLTHGRCRGQQFRVRLRVKPRADGSQVRFSGNYPLACGRWSITRSVLAPNPYFTGAFNSLWREIGGTFSGATRVGALPPSAVRLLRWPSEALSDIIRLINKYSNNVMARQLLLTLGAEHAGAPGTLVKGRQAIADWLAAQALHAPGLYVDNGAGLSRKARISAKALTDLLVYAWRQPTLPEFVSTLPLSAINGTLRKRFRLDALHGKLHMKTGSLKHAEAIAGYLHSRSGRVLAVAILHNSKRLGTRSAQRVQDALLGWLYRSH